MTPEGAGKRTKRKGPKAPFWEGVLREIFPPPSCLDAPFFCLQEASCLQ